jgi:hypothetical protein
LTTAVPSIASRRIFFQRCFYLFVALLVLVADAPLFEPTPNGRIAINLINLFVIVAAVSTLGRSVASFVVVLLLAVVVEQLVGALFVSILIARLAGVYPPRRR